MNTVRALGEQCAQAVGERHVASRGAGWVRGVLGEQGCVGGGERGVQKPGGL